MSLLDSSQRYAAGGLFALALHQAQIHQSRLGPSVLRTDDDDAMHASKVDSITHDSKFWVHENAGLLRPVFRFLEIDDNAWHGLEETGVTSSAKGHIAAFSKLLSEGSDENCSERLEKEIALMKAVDAMLLNMETAPVSSDSVREKECKFEHDCYEKLTVNKKQSKSEVGKMPSEIDRLTDYKMSGHILYRSGSNFSEESIEDVALLSHQRKVVVLYELLSACLANTPEYDKKGFQHRQGYDARHRVALRLLASWLDVKWMKMEAMELIVTCSVMAIVKKEEGKGEETKSSDSSWSSWKRGGIIGAAALTGGTLMAVTAGLAAPAIAAGFGALAPTLGTIVPVIGASGFAAAASAAGSVAGSIAVAASFGAAGAGLTGCKMARRIAEIDEFEFKAIGDNHNQGCLAVGIVVSGLVFEEEDFIIPWKAPDYNLERYALQWESKNLAALSTAIQDWLTSKLTVGLMQQGAMLTVLGALVSALAVPSALVTASDFIDNQWAVTVNRADQAGKLLAEVLLQGLQGNRPVTLIGFSLGARVIFKCLQCLAEKEENVGLVERVVLLGAPVPLANENWEGARKMVAGRFVNVFSTDDWTLGVAFRASLMSQGLAGIQPVECPGIENVDVTELVEGHSTYLCATRHILEQLQLDEFYPALESPPSPVAPEHEKSKEV